MNLEFWIIFAIVMFILELITLTFFMFSLGVGSVCAAISTYYGYDLLTQIVVFIIATIICIVVFKPLSKRLYKNNSDKKSNTERFIGNTAIVTSKITPTTTGNVIIENETWLAVSDKTIEVDTQVTVIKIEGIKLVVE